MNEPETIEKMFDEIGLGDDHTRLELTDRIRFDFDFTKNQSQDATEITTSENTKSEHICPIGTK